MSITSHLTSRITSSLTGVINLVKELPRLVLSVNNIGLVNDANGGALTNGRSTTQTVLEYTGKMTDCLTGEIRYDRGRRYYFNNGVIYNAGIAGVRYFDTLPGDILLVTVYGDSYTADRSFLGINMPTLIGAFYNTQGVGGDTLTQIEAKFAATAPFSVTDFHFLEGGGNDIMNAIGGADPVPTMKIKMAAMTDQSDVLGIPYLVFTVPPVSTNIVAWDGEAQSRSEEYNQWVRDTYPDDHIDMYEILGDPLNPTGLNPDYAQSDLLHITPVGTLAIDEVTAAKIGNNQGAKLSPAPKMQSNPAYTNQSIRSEDFSTGWSFTNMAPNSPAELDFYGESGASKFIPSSGSSQHFAHMDSSITTGLDYSQSFFVAANGYDHVQIASSAGFDGANTWANYDLTNGTLKSKGSAVLPEDVSIEQVLNGYIISLSSTSQATIMGRFILSVIGNSDVASRLPSFNADGTSGVNVIGGQLTQTKYPMPYAKTIASSTSIGADNIKIPTAIGTNFNQVEGAAIIRFTPEYAAADQTNNEGIVSLDGSGFNLIINGASVSASFDGANLPIVSSPWAFGGDVILSVVWSTSESKLSISSSIDGGVTWATWVETAYDGAFTSSGFFEIFKILGFSADMESLNIYKTLYGRTVIGMQDWVEVNAVNL